MDDSSFWCFRGKRLIMPPSELRTSISMSLSIYSCVEVMLLDCVPVDVSLDGWRVFEAPRTIAPRAK